MSLAGLFGGIFTGLIVIAVVVVLHLRAKTTAEQPWNAPLRPR